MNIAIAVDGDNMKSIVSEQLEFCKNLLVVNVDTQELLVFANSEATEEIAGERLAQKIIEHNCEAVITGLIKPTAFNIIADNCVTRFLGVGHTASTSLELMDSNNLDVIRAADGQTGCGGSHHHDH